MAFLKNPVILTGLLVLILIALIWFVGPQIGFVRVDLRIFLALALIVLWVIFVALSKNQPAASVQATVSPPATPTLSLPVQAPQVNVPNAPSGVQVQVAGPSPVVRPGQTDDPSAFRSQLERAIQWLRGSKIAKSRQGVDVVYQLPWYVVIGPPGSGKSMCLAQSNLDFPYTDPDRAMGRRGIEATKSCDLWIANDALFIDTSGRYSTEDKGKEAWLGMLDQIKRYRKDKPLDGVILAVDLASVLEADEDVLKEQARRLRSRLDEMTQRLGLVLPVYLVFNKCDLVDGFVEFFNDLADEERTQVWGCTLKREQYQSLQPHQEFGKEFNQLYEALIARRLSRLTSKAPENKDKIYSFPLQLTLAKDQLVDYITWLFQPSTFRERPIFRGFYFTSSLQEGSGIDLVSKYMIRKVGALEALADFGGRRDAVPHFIRNLLTQVIFPDRLLSGPSSTSKIRGLLARLALILALGVILPIILWCVISSYTENEHLLATVDRATRSEPRADKAAADLEVLRDLRIHLEKFDEHYPGLARSFQWGMYIGDQILEPARKIYSQRLKQVFVNACAQDLKIELRNLTTSPEMETRRVREITGRNYFLLKTYLMMSEPLKAEEKYLTADYSELSKFWSQKVLPENKAEAEQQLAFYVHQLAVHKEQNPHYLISRNLEDEQLVARKREFLLTFDVSANYYNTFKAQVNKSVVSMTLSRALEGKDLDLFNGSPEIPGAFSRNGWETQARNEIARDSDDYDRNVWVLAKAAPGLDPQKPSKEAMQAKLNELYFNDYNREWWNFLSGVQFRSFSNRREAVDKLARISKSQDSPIYRLLKSVSANTFEELDNKPADNPYQAALVRNFQSIHRFMVGADGQRQPISQYLDVLAKVYQEIYTFSNAGEPPDQISRMRQVILDALSSTALLTQNFDPESQRLVKPLLEQPIRMAWTLAPVGDTQSPGAAPTLGPLTPPTPSTAGGGLVVRGTVRATGGTPVGGATVYLLKEGSHEPTLDNMVTVARSDPDGKFQFPKAISPGKYSIYARGRGYRQKSGDVSLATGRSGLEIVLVPE